MSAFQFIFANSGHKIDDFLMIRRNCYTVYLLDKRLQHPSGSTTVFLQFCGKRDGKKGATAVFRHQARAAVLYYR